MSADSIRAKEAHAAAHEASQQLQVLSMVLSAIERRDGCRHAGDLEAARRAVEILDRKLDELAALACRD